MYLYPHSDVFVAQSDPNTNYAQDASLWMGKDANGDLLYTRILFDGIPYGAEIVSATLRLYRHSGHGSLTLQVQCASHPWLENTLTWNTPDSTSRWSEPSSTYYMGEQNDYVNVDVSDHVTAWADGVRNNYGFQLSPYESWNLSPGNYQLVYSSENGSTSYQPRLEIVYSRCPDYDYSRAIDTNWGTHSSSITGGGSKEYRFYLMAGSTYTFKTGCGDGANAAFDTTLTLRDADCEQVAFDDDGCGLRSEISYTVISQSGYYCLDVAGFDSSDSGSYTLAYREECGMESTAPLNVSANPASMCLGGTSTLACEGGSLGTGASWEWYRGSCGGTYVGSGQSITVSPSVTTTYFVRAEGDCNATTCASVTVTLAQAVTWYRDSDGDGFGDPNITSEGCTQPSGYVADNRDCDDSCFSCHPGGTEVCDGEDNNCDDQTDEGGVCDQSSTWYRDADNDGFGDPNNSTEAIQQPAGYVADNRDCDDSCFSCHPGGTEVCDGMNNDCDEQIDEGGVCDALGPDPLCQVELCGICLVPGIIGTLAGLVVMKRRRRCPGR